MTPLTTQQLLTIAYNMFSTPSESGANGAATYTLSVPSVTGSGITIGVNQIDFGQNPAYANQLVAQANQYATANPQLGLSQLSAASIQALTGQLGNTGTTVSTLQSAASNPTLTAFLSTSSGHNWVDQASGQYTGQAVNALVSNLSGSPAGQQILSDPEMFSLVLEVRNNVGHVPDLPDLLNSGTATFRDGTTISLTPDQLSGTTPLTINDLQSFLVHEYLDSTSSQALKVGGQFTTDAAATASGFQAGTLVTPPSGFMSGGKIITGSVDDPLSLDALAVAALGNTQLASSAPVGGQAEAVSAQWQGAVAGDTGQFNGYQSLPSGDIVVHSSAGNDYVLHLDGSVTKFSGTTDGAVVNANGTLTVFSSPGAFTWDPSSGTISGSDPGSTAVFASINGPSGPETVTLLGTGGSAPFAVISSGGTATAGAGAPSSNVLAYPQGPVARTAEWSHRRRCGSLGISHDRGRRRTVGRAALWGFIRREGHTDGHRQCRSAGQDRFSEQVGAGFGHVGRRFGMTGIAESAAATNSRHTRRLPVAIGPGTISVLRDGIPGLGHDVSFGFGGQGL